MDQKFRKLFEISSENSFQLHQSCFFQLSFHAQAEVEKQNHLCRLY